MSNCRKGLLPGLKRADRGKDEPACFCHSGPYSTICKERGTEVRRKSEWGGGKYCRRLGGRAMLALMLPYTLISKYRHSVYPRLNRKKWCYHAGLRRKFKSCGEQKTKTPVTSPRKRRRVLENSSGSDAQKAGARNSTIRKETRSLTSAALKTVTSG